MLKMSRAKCFYEEEEVLFSASSTPTTPITSSTSTSNTIKNSSNPSTIHHPAALRLLTIEVYDSNSSFNSSSSPSSSSTLSSLSSISSSSSSTTTTRARSSSMSSVNVNRKRKSMLEELVLQPASSKSNSLPKPLTHSEEPLLNEFLELAIAKLQRRFSEIDVLKETLYHPSLPSLLSSIKGFVHKLKIKMPVTVTALIYLDRFCGVVDITDKKVPFAIFHKLAVCCLILANKYADDAFYENKTWKSSWFPLEEINEMEIKILLKYNFNLRVDERDLNKYFDENFNLVTSGPASPRRWFKYLDL